MTTAGALVLLGFGVLALPVPTEAQRRLGRLAAVSRVAGRVAVAVPAARVERTRRPAVLAVLAAVVVVAGLAGGPALAVAGGAVTGAVAIVVLSARGARREAAVRRDLLTALALLRGELEAGVPFVDALVVARERAGDAGSAFDLGETTDDRHADALASARRCLTAGAGLVAVTGAPWAAVAAGIGRDVAARDAREREVGSALAGARASTVVLAGLPVLGLGLAVALGADPVGFLLHTAAGRWVLAVGATLDLLGVVTSTAVAARAAR